MARRSPPFPFIHSSSIGGKGTGYFIKPRLSLLSYPGQGGIWGTFFLFYRILNYLNSFLNRNIFFPSFLEKAIGIFSKELSFFSFPFSFILILIFIIFLF